MVRIQQIFGDSLVVEQKTHIDIDKLDLKIASDGFNGYVTSPVLLLMTYTTDRQRRLIEQDFRIQKDESIKTAGYSSISKNCRVLAFGDRTGHIGSALLLPGWYVDFDLKTRCLLSF
jgi:hypothetical protein